MDKGKPKHPGGQSNVPVISIQLKC